ncbi:hypothetical protein ATCC90586_005991 [Pythium insidiosum]|nr:hypothetical protein ATCC90586_005991 [Pythium insidiosum]
MKRHLEDAEQLTTAAASLPPADGAAPASVAAAAASSPPPPAVAVSVSPSAVLAAPAGDAVAESSALMAAADVTAAAAAAAAAAASIGLSATSSAASTPTAAGVDANANANAGASSASTPSAAPALLPPALNAPPSVSAVWSYFDKDTMGNSICKFCERVIKGHHSSNLLSHLRTAGRTDTAHQQASAICEEHRENKRNIKRQKMAIPTAAEFAVTYPHLIAAAAAAAVPALGGQLAFKKDSPLVPSSVAALAAAAAAATLTKDQRDTSSVILPQPMGLTADQLAQDFAVTVLVDNLPLTVASQPGFENMMQLLLGEKKSLLPDQETLVKNILMLQQSLSLTTKMLLARTRTVGLSIEAWRHPLPELAPFSQYLVVSAHFSLDYRAYHVTVSCTPVGCGVDLPTLKTILDQTLERFAIKDKVIAWTLGDVPWREGAEVPLSTGDLPTTFTPMNLDGRLVAAGTQSSVLVPCAASLLRRILHKEQFMASFPHFVISIDVFLRRLTSRPESYSLLKRRCPLLDPERGDLAYFDLLRHLQEALPVVESIAQEFGVEPMPVATVDWIGHAVKILRPFVRYADAFAGEKQRKSGSNREIFKDGLSSVSTILSAVCAYLDKPIQPRQGEDATAYPDALTWKSFFEPIAKDVQTRFGTFPSICFASTLLDPRYKNRDYCYVDPETERARAEEFLRRIADVEPADSALATVDTPSKTTDDREDSAVVEDDEDEDLLAHLPTATGAKDPTQANPEVVATWAKELGAFLSLPAADRNVDPLSWWKENQHRFPVLAPYAEMLLALPAAAISGDSVMDRVNAVLLRADGRFQDPVFAANPVLADAFLLFQKNRQCAVEWFRNHATVAADPALVAEADNAGNFKHIENV